MLKKPLTKSKLFHEVLEWLEVKKDIPKYNKAFYRRPITSIKLNGETDTQHNSTKNKTRLSTLSIFIQNNSEVLPSNKKTRGDQKHNNCKRSQSIFVDDTVVYISNPKYSIRELLQW